MAAPALLLVLHRIFKKKKNLKSRCHTKRRVGAAMHARPSFGMTTQDFKDLFVCRNQFNIRKTIEVGM